MNLVFGLFALVCRWWKTSGWRLTPPLSLHLAAPWGVSLPAPLFSEQCVCVCACVWRALPLLPPPLPFAFFLHLLQSQHASVCSLSCFPATLRFLAIRKCPFFLYFWLMRESAGTNSREVWVGEMGQSLVVTLEYWGRRWTGGEHRMG